MSRKLITIEIK